MVTAGKVKGGDDAEEEAGAVKCKSILSVKITLKLPAHIPK
jgi:hypothetical protein